MGAWSEDAFGNDSACDWVGDFLDEPGLAAVCEALEVVNEADDYLEVDEACHALVACEVIARLQGKWGVRDSYSEDIDNWVEANPTQIPQSLKNLADAAVVRILAQNSELQELWDEDGPNPAWHAAVDDLRNRIKV